MLGTQRDRARWRWALVSLVMVFVALLLIGPQTTPADATVLTPDGSVLLSGAGPVEFSSPTLVDLDGDSRSEILVGTRDGKVFALKYSASGSHLTILWSHDTSREMGCPTGIHGAISAGDLDGQGIKIVVPIGAVNEAGKCGGIDVLDRTTGNSLWTFHDLDYMSNSGAGGPDGISDPVVSTPALADIDKDGKLEIMFGGFDQHVYALRSNGTMEPGNWPVFVRDTVWSSPAIADLDKDGYPEIVIGVDAHYEPGLPNSAPNGGCLYAFRRDGSTYWRQCINQVIFSSPAIGDLNGDGQLEIVHGTGEFYQTAEGQGAGFKIYVRDALGNLKWTGATGGYTREAPALGDINGDGKLEVVAVALDHRAYAWKSDGTPMWSPVMPTIYNGSTNNGAGWTLSAPVIAHYPGDTSPDIFTNLGWESAVLRGTTGSQLTGTSMKDSRPSYLSGYTTANNSPAIGDIDGDGKPELVLASANNSGSTGQVFFWRLNVTSSSSAPWPMFHRDARHTGLIVAGPQLAVTPPSITLMHQLGDSSSEHINAMVQNTGEGSFNWSMTLPGRVSASPSVGTTSTSQQATITISTSSLSLGIHLIGNISVTATSGSNPVPGSPVTIPVTLNIVQQLYKMFLPSVAR